MAELPIIASRIRAARAMRKANQAALMERTGRSQKTVSNWENGRTEPEASEIAQIARVLEVSADYLVGLTEHPQGLRPGAWVIDLDLADQPVAGQDLAFEIPARARLATHAEALEIQRQGALRMGKDQRSGDRKGRSDAEN